MSSTLLLFLIILVTLGVGAALGVAWSNVALVRPARQRLQNKVQNLEQQTGQAMSEKDQQMARLGRIRTAMSSDDKQIWMRYDTSDAPIFAPKIRKSIPIITIANLKGGVGKTTLCANLAAYFEKRHAKRVLLIDLDYQGSLSALCLNAANSFFAEESLARHLIKGDKQPEWLPYAALELGDVLPQSRILPSFYDFATVENQVMLEWLLGDRQDDARFTMARFLHSQAVQDAYDLILLDCPPRLTTGVINALTSATHLLVPTKLDRMSSQAVTTFLRQLREMRPLLFPELEVLGVVGTMVDNSVSLTSTEAGIWEDLAMDLPPQWGKRVHLFRGAEIPQKSAVAAASGSSYVYLKDPATRQILNALGDAMLEQIG